MAPINLYDLDLTQLSSLLAQWGYGRYHAEQVWKAIYVDRVTAVSQITTIHKYLQQKLQANATLNQLTIQTATNS